MMLDFQQKRKVRSFMYHRVTLWVLAIFTLIVLHSTWSVYQKKRESEEVRAVSQKHVAELRARNADLNYKIDRLDTTPGLEEEIRSKFTVAKSNENVVVVVDDPSLEPATTTGKVSWWQRLRSFIAGN